MLSAYATELQNGTSFSDMISEIFLCIIRLRKSWYEYRNKKKMLVEIENIYKKKKPLRIEKFDGISITFFRLLVCRKTECDRRRPKICSRCKLKETCRK